MRQRDSELAKGWVQFVLTLWIKTVGGKQKMDSDNRIKLYIEKVICRDELFKSNWGTICPPVEMQAADGKER
jgi:hypothetical protein